MPGDRRQRHVRRSQHAGALPARTAATCTDREAPALFTDNETNGERAYGPGNTSRKPHTKDAFHRAICERDPTAVRPDGRGTKAALHYQLHGACAAARSRCACGSPTRRPRMRSPTVDTIIAARKAEADTFYAGLAPREATADERLVQRRALAGLLWTKQSYLFDVARWLDGDDPAQPPPPSRRTIRNSHWRHLNSMRVMSMPDKWEYPWFAAWDLAFQCVPFALVDAKFAKDQLWLLLFEQFQHPSGQLPAYEWEFGDLNPPVHAWAVWRVYNMDRIRNGHADRQWLERCFHKLLINFASWVNKVDRDGNNVFEGGFLGLDNITVIDRSEPSPDGAVLEQSDATGWMGMFCLNLMRIALELARENPVYEGMATKFLQHYVYVAYAMKNMGGRDVQLFDSEDGFFYDVLRYPDGSSQKFRVRSLVGLIPLFAVERLELEWIEPFKEFTANLNWFLKNRRRPGRLGHPPTRGGRRQDDLPADDRRHRAAAPVARPRARRARVPVALRHPLAIEAARGAAVRVGRSPRGLRARRVGREAQGRQLELARADLVSDDVPHHRIAAQARHRVRVALPRRDIGLGRPAHRAAGDRARYRPPDDRHLPARQKPAAAGVRRRAEVRRRSQLARSPAVLRVLPRRQRRRHRREPPDRVDRARRQPDRRVAMTPITPRTTGLERPPDSREAHQSLLWRRFGASRPITISAFCDHSQFVEVSVRR